MKTAIVTLLFSTCLHLACFWKWPGDPDWDVNHSVYAAQNFLEHQRLESINLFPEPTDDLARHARLVWMTHWPPAHSLLFLAVMELGLAPGPATKALIVFCILAGGLGWLLIARHLDAAPGTLLVIAVAYPWISFIARSYLDYKNDHLACALAPYVYFCVLRIEPLRKIFPSEQWGRLALAAILAGITIIVKYSMTPVIVGTGLYMLWLDGRDFSRKRIVRVAFFGATLALPTVALWSINQIWGGNKYPLLGGGLPFSLPVFAKNVVSHTFGFATGWDLVFIQLNIALEKFGHHLTRGLVFGVSLAVLILWTVYLARRRWEKKEQQYLVYLILMSAALFAMLAVTTILSRIKYDFSSDGRFSIPVSFGWLLLVVVTLGKAQARTKLRVAVICSLVIPIVFSACLFGGTGLFKQPYLRLPESKMMWSESYDPAHVAFIGRLHAFKPDLVVPTDGRFLVEFDVPALYISEMSQQDGHVYWSSRDLKILAIIHPEEQQTFLWKFRRASTIEPVPAPAEFPYLVYELQYRAQNPASLD